MQPKLRCQWQTACVQAKTIASILADGFLSPVKPSNCTMTPWVGCWLVSPAQPFLLQTVGRVQEHRWASGRSGSLACDLWLRNLAQWSGQEESFFTATLSDSVITFLWSSLCQCETDQAALPIHANLRTSLPMPRVPAEVQRRGGVSEDSRDLNMPWWKAIFLIVASGFFSC